MNRLQLNILDPYMIPLKILSSEYLYEEGSTSKGIYCIQSGIVVTSKLYQSKHIFFNFSKEEKKLIPLSGIKSDFYTHSALAITDVEAKFIRKPIIEKLILEEPSFGVFLMKELCDEIASVESKWLKMFHKTAKQHLAMLFLELIKIFGLNENQHINFKTSYHEIAKLSATSVHNLMKIIKEFSVNKILEVNDDEIKIINLNKLEEVLA